MSSEFRDGLGRREGGDRRVFVEFITEFLSLTIRSRSTAETIRSASSPSQAPYHTPSGYCATIGPSPH